MFLHFGLYIFLKCIISPFSDEENTENAYKPAQYIGNNSADVIDGFRKKVIWISDNLKERQFAHKPDDETHKYQNHPDNELPFKKYSKLHMSLGGLSNPFGIFEPPTYSLEGCHSVQTELQAHNH